MTYARSTGGRDMVVCKILLRAELEYFNFRPVENYNDGGTLALALCLVTSIAQLDKRGFSFTFRVVMYCD